jgi:predicted RNase H-like nuclease (RuvC/YqgF family)
MAGVACHILQNYRASQAYSAEKECDCMIHIIIGRWKITVVLTLAVLFVGLACIGSSRAQIKKEDVDFEVLATVAMVKGDTLWGLAQKYYDDPYRRSPNSWDTIMSLNKIPNVRRISIGTVIYIPVKDAKEIVKQISEEIEVKKEAVIVDTEGLKKVQDEIAELKAKLKECQARNKKLAAALEECRAKNKKLTEALQKKDAIIEAKDATNKELKAMLDELKAVVAEIKNQAAQGQKMHDMQCADCKKKDEIIEELESKIRRQRREIEELEEVREKLIKRIKEIEEGQAETPTAKMPPKAKEAIDPRAKVAAVAIALVGSILWIYSK